MPHWHEHARILVDSGELKHAIRALAGGLANIEARINFLEKRMADQTQQLSDDIAALQQAEADAKTRVGSAVAALQAQIDDLKAHPASADLTAQIAALEGVTADLATIAAPAATAATPANTLPAA